MNSVVWGYERGRGGRENGDCKGEDEGRKLKKKKKKKERQKWRRGEQRGEQLQKRRGERAVAVWLRRAPAVAAQSESDP